MTMTDYGEKGRRGRSLQAHPVGAPVKATDNDARGNPESGWPTHSAGTDAGSFDHKHQYRSDLGGIRDDDARTSSRVQSQRTYTVTVTATDPSV